MKHLWMAACLLSALACGSGRAAEAEFQFTRNIVAPQSEQVELLAAPFDSAVYANTQSGLTDVRLFDGQGNAVPYVLQKARTTRTEMVRRTWTGRQIAARPLKAGGLEIIVELPNDDPAPQGIKLVTPLTNFEHRVRVFSSAAGDDWTPAGEDAVIFDYSRYIDVRTDEIPLSETSHRRFRIVIDDITAAQESELLTLSRRLRGTEEIGREERVNIDRRPFRIEHIEFWRDELTERIAGDKLVAYPLKEFRVEQNPEQHHTLIYMRSDGEPLTSLKVDTATKNFSRRAAVEVEASAGAQPSWTQIGQATLSHLDFKTLQREHVSIGFPESRQTSYRIVIDNRDGPPLDINGVTAQGHVYEALFLANPQTQYRLAYGSPNAPVPQFDTAAIAQVLDEGFRPTMAELGPVVTGLVAEPSRGWADLLNNRPLLLSIILLLIAALGWGLYRAVRRVDNLPSE